MVAIPITGLILTEVADLGAFAFHHHQPELIVSSPRLEYDAGITEQKMTISAYGGKSIRWRVATNSPDGAIISAKPNSGILQNGEKAKITITVDRANLADGRYNGYIAFMSPAQSIETKVSILVNSASPEIKLSRNQLEVEATLNEATPEPRQVQIRNSGTGNFTWTAQKKFNAEWLRLTPA